MTNERPQTDTNTQQTLPPRALNVAGLLAFIQRHPGVAAWLHDAAQRAPLGEATPPALDVARPARAALIAATATVRTPLCVITARPERAISLSEEIRRWAPDGVPVLEFPDTGAHPYERAPWSHERIRRRLDVLSRLALAPDAPAIIVTSVHALVQPTVPADHFRRYVRRYEVGQQVSLAFMLASWHAMGYEHVTTVTVPGQYSHRGGILDIYPIQYDWPVRIELWGDEIDSLRVFDPETQRSVETITDVVVPPASEAILHRLPDDVAQRLTALNLEPLHEVAQAEWREAIGRLLAGQRFSGVEFFIPYLYAAPGFFLDYLAPQALIMLDDWDEVALASSDLERDALRLRDEQMLRKELPPNAAPAIFTWDDLRERLEDGRAVVLGYGPESADYGLESAFAAAPHFGGRLHEAVQALKRHAGQQTQVVITRQAQTLREALDRARLSPVERTDVATPPKEKTLTLVRGTLGEGFVLNSPDGEPLLTLLTDAELYGWKRATPRRAGSRTRRTTLENLLEEIAPGDYVVHIEHGIGIYRGLVQREVQGVVREYLEIEYANNDRLYVPVHQSDRVARYIGPADAEPRIHRLGTTDWETARRQAKRAVDDIAEELLELYIAREQAEGFAFSPDTPWQLEMEAQFPYEETEDQLRAIEEVKRDMESPRPMDRLVCGDVGFGKTEVALRAAFKAVQDGKQVAVLVPTTVLALQHYRTFSKRLAPFAVEVEMLNRLRTPQQQQHILNRLAAGQVDIIIGTHRLLSDDVLFHDLGLLIIDEEQRFGVIHKEKLKKLRTSIDVLTLTATPIPRTLHMALSGVRDLSTIDTPPEERLPVITRLLEWSDDAIRLAIRQELDRGGQVFFVHNRVMSIYAVAQRVQALVPEARVAVAHGQMPERELEQVMLEFAEGEHDILVCTAIIENGLDLPNVNTIIIDHAERFGLAQLYQLRGRVGRGTRRGYAYLIHPPEQTLTYEALERLKTIREATELGAGFRIALKDLQLRGAGDILGARQSGHIAAVGFDMYTKLLAKAVEEKRAARGLAPAAVGGVAPPSISDEQGPLIDLGVPAFLPHAYIPREEDRLRIYRRLAQARTLDDADDIEHELRDRFGPLPEPAAALLDLLRVRLLARAAGVTAVRRRGETLIIELPGPAETRLLAQAGVLADVAAYGRRDLRLQVGEGWQAVLLDALQTILNAIETLAVNP
ncbi:transcription-repair coupling factor [Ardenticatena maritima]|uniref:Transcription-repair-coupling factor n=1 Tax=Ardenticatena maritima TaxID=872965 RepID=A0A0M9UDD6_9CHLR|nr:transcription-repair coupling factor [Ardenticatena maritima]KPL89097.1 hypothetical protein SE16_00705 [Ardenticatena maritima]GAP63830.1 transcription-repair coupling factor [Ardenticatena maritima]